MPFGLSGYCFANAASHCRMRRLLEEWQEELEDEFNSITVADLVGREREKHPVDFCLSLQINLAENTYTRLYAYPEHVREKVPLRDAYDSLASFYLNTFIHEEDREKMANFTSCARIKEYFQDGQWEREVRCLWRNEQKEDRYVRITMQMYYDAAEETALVTWRSTKQISRYMEKVESRLKENDRKLEEYYWKMISMLSQVLDDNRIEGKIHQNAIVHYTELIYRKLNELYPEMEISEDEISSVSRLAPIHDIGKIRIPAEILHKETAPTPEEMEQIKTHTLVGAEITQRFPEGENLKEWNQYCFDICHSHHERYDGGGYPDGLSGEAIPRCAQIVGLADAYDALTSDRSYQRIFTHEEAVQLILSGKCGAFSDQLLHSFLAAAMQPEWKKVQ